MVNLDFLKQPIITEKTTKFIEQKQYIFDVDPKLTKKQMKKIIYSNYRKRVKSIRTYRILKNTNIKKRVIFCFEKTKAKAQ
uniref:Large ribosomal subunit protein uL23c n=1 Tax=Rhipiliopsis peltata TaxID=2320810 RepID=A0A386B1E2_9CHLO|nr:ribosomal protein L23 [Rhipiliopsis peltata]AYC65516.1 ribosomal protein L23 [Rhipiliopsis peltata]